MLKVVRALKQLGRMRRELAVKAAQDRLIKSIVRRDIDRLRN